MNRKLLNVLIVLCITLLAFSGCGTKDESVDSQNNISKPIAVNTSKVTKMAVESVITLNGKVIPNKEINIYSKLPGKVERVNFDIGQKVKKGDILFILEDKDFRLQLNQSQAALNIAKASLSRTKGGSLEQQMVQLKSALVSAETNFNDAKLNYERTKHLYEAGASSKQMLEAAESRYKLSEEQYKSAKTNYYLTEEKINPENIATAEAQVQQAQAAFDMAKSQLDNTVVKSPINGVISVKNVKVGEMISGAVIAVGVVDLSSAIVDIGVTEDIVNKLKLNDKVHINIRAANDNILEGKIISISPVVDPKTQTYPVKVEISNNNGWIKGGMFAEIKFTVDKAENVLAVPLESIIDDNGKKVVYTLKGDIAVRKEVTLGFTNEMTAQLIGGLQLNDTIIIKGQEFLQDGSKVIISDK